MARTVALRPFRLVALVAVGLAVATFVPAGLAACHREPEGTVAPPRSSAGSARTGGGATAAVDAGSLGAEASGVSTVVPATAPAVPHDHAWFTQGLAFWNGRLFEGTGMYGESLVHELDPHTGRELRRVTSDPALFGEGITIFHDQLFQLTWREHVCVVYDAGSLRRLRQMSYDGEGWGITSDGASLVTSDGSSTLSFRDAETFRVVRTVSVTYDGRPVTNLNELEAVRGEIWANVWQTDFIVRISPEDGHVIGRLDLSSLLPSSERADNDDDVLNGIAFDEQSGRLLVTGKRWPRLFDVTWP